MKKYEKLVNEILLNIGGAENISSVTHCMTRLRFNLKDLSKTNNDALSNVKGVLGITQSGGQYQVIIGQSVGEVYNQLLETAQIDGDKTGDKLTVTQDKNLKYYGNKILDTLAGSLTPLIPVLIAASMFKMLVVILGPTMLKVISEGSSIYTLLTFVGDAGFYFFPVFIGYTASKKMGVTPVLGLFLGAILIHPTFIGLIDSGTKLSLFGLSITPQNYTSTVIPMILSIWVMSYVERFFKKVIPSMLGTILVPTLTMVVMIPLSLGIFGPLGFVLGEYISKGLLSLDSIGGFLAVPIIAALWQFVVMTGMHLLMITTMITVFAQNGQEAMVAPAGIASSMAVVGMCLGAFLYMKNKENKATAFSFVVACFIGGVTEPGVYGIGVRYRKPFIGMMIGAFAGGLYAGITNVTAYALIPVANFTALASFVGGSTKNLVNGVITCVISIIVAAIATYMLGLEEKGADSIG